MIYGTLNTEKIVNDYEGLSTETAVVTVDNKDNTIKVDVIGGGSGSTGAVRFDAIQELSNTEAVIAQENIKIGNNFLRISGTGQTNISTPTNFTNLGVTLNTTVGEFNSGVRSTIILDNEEQLPDLLNTPINNFQRFMIIDEVVE